MLVAELRSALRAVRVACAVGRRLQPGIIADAAGSAISKVDTSPVTVRGGSWKLDGCENWPGQNLLGP